MPTLSKAMVCAARLVIIVVSIVGLAAAAQSSPDDLWDQYRELALAASDQGKPIDAEKYWRAALQVAERFAAADSRQAIALNNLGGLCFSTGRYDEAITYLKRELALRERLAPEGNRYTINTLNTLAMVYSAQGAVSEAEKCYKKALGLVDAAAAERPPVGLAFLLHNLGALYLSQYRFPEAEAVYERLLEVAQSDPTGTTPGGTPGAANDLAGVYEQEGKYGDAERLLLDAVTAQEQKGRADYRLGQALCRLANHHQGQEEYERAAMLYERALEVFEKLNRDLAVGFGAGCLTNLAELYDKWKMPDKAEDAYQRELKMEMDALGKNNASMPMALIGLGNLYREQGRLEEIEPLVVNALTVQEQRLGPEHYGVADTLLYLAGRKAELDKNSEAEPLLLRAIAIQEKSLGPNHPQLANTLEQYARVLRATGREAEAARISERVEQMRLHRGQ